MITWDAILRFEKRPAISSLELSPIAVAHNRKRRNVYEDVVQVCPTMFAATNRRNTIEGKRNDEVTDFFWANETESLLRAVYGDLNMPITASKPPPNELLINAGRFRYNELVEDAEAKRLNPWKNFIWSSIASPTSLCLTIYRWDYYFVCSQDESAEFKNWKECQPAAIGFRTFLGKPLG